MGYCLPFSDIDLHQKIFDEPPFCLMDSSFLVSLSDCDHSFFDDASFFAEKLSSFETKIFVSVTARTEFIDYHRRVLVTEQLMNMLAPSSPWRISSAIRAELVKQKGWIDHQPRLGNEPYLSDSRIKDCKQVFLPKTQSGHIGWIEFCREFLSGKLMQTWETISEKDLALNYIDMRSEDANELFVNGLEWASMYRLAEQTALSSNDAMILNLFSSSVIPALITMDFDLAYGVMASSPDDKVVFVPDNLYRNRLKKLRF